jgi:hypothetical protein
VFCSVGGRGDPRGPLARPLLPLVGYHRVRVGAVTLACVPYPACVSGAQVGHPVCLSVLDRMFEARVGLPPVVPCRAC